MPEAYVATVTGVIVFVGGLTRLALLLELAWLPAVIAPKPQPGVGGPGLAVGRGRFLKAVGSRRPKADARRNMGFRDQPPKAKPEEGGPSLPSGSWGRFSFGT